MNRICTECNVREPHEHKCLGGDCTCDRLTCQVHQKRLTLQEAAKIAFEQL